MTRSDRVRRAMTLTLAVLCFLVVPQLAFAKFDSGAAAGLNIGTASLVTPSSPTGSYVCTSSSNKKEEGADVTVTGFTVAGQPSGVSYVYTLYRGNSLEATATSAGRQATLVSPLAKADKVTTVYRVTIEPRLGAWIAPAFSLSFTCG